MNIYTDIKTAQTPSFGMSARDAAASPIAACPGAVEAKRVRQLGGIAAGTSVVTVMAQGAFPGTRAWRPPVC
jgi:hypothetical protein